MKFFLSLVPPTVTAQEHQVKIFHGRPFFYDPPKVKEARALLRMNLRQFRPVHPFEGAVELHALWLFPRGKSHKHGQWRITRPDTDNLQKMLKDCMTAEFFWKDDAQVVREVCEKKWSAEPVGILIEITALEAVDREEICSSEKN